MTGTRWRCFVAVPIDERLRADLEAAREAWRRSADLRWTAPEGWHVTLAFLGSIEAGDVPRLVQRLLPIARAHRPSRHDVGHLGAFPTPARARVAWCGIDDGPDRCLERLAGDVAASLDLGTTTPFRAHLTLARSRRPVDLRPWLASASVPAGAIEVDRIELMRSHLGTGPARYETLATMTLGMADGA